MKIMKWVEVLCPEITQIDLMDLEIRSLISRFSSL
jgi:hypothetical protein